MKNGTFQPPAAPLLRSHVSFFQQVMLPAHHARDLVFITSTDRHFTGTDSACTGTFDVFDTLFFSSVLH